MKKRQIMMPFLAACIAFNACSKDEKPVEPVVIGQDTTTNVSADTTKVVPNPNLSLSLRRDLL